MNCPHQMNPHPADRQKNALRVESIIDDTPCCALMPTDIAKQRKIDPMRWYLSGGCPVGIAHRCVGENNCKIYTD